MDFLDKVKDGISKGIDTIGAKSKELVEDAQVQLQLGSLRDRRHKALENLGLAAYALHRKEGLADPASKDLCEAIADLDRQIELKVAELKHEVPAKVAPAALVKCDCGTELATGVRFCSACGKPRG